MEIDPNTAIGTGLAILGSKDILNRMLGPTAEYIGDETKHLVEKANVNLGEIFRKAAKKLGPRIDQSGVYTAFAAHPERFVNKPPAPLALPSAVWINPPNKKDLDDNGNKNVPEPNDKKGLLAFDCRKPDAPSAHPRPGYPTSSCVPALLDSVSPGTVILPDKSPPENPPSDTRAMPKKIPGAWGLAPTSKENCSQSESTLH